MFSVVVIPGKVWGVGDLMDAAGLNLTANPTIAVDGDLEDLGDFGFVESVAKTFTVADFVNEFLEAPGHGILNHGQRVRVSSTGTLPAGLVASAVSDYFARVITIDRLTLHHTYAGALAGTDTVDIGDAGSGVHTLTYTPLKTGIALIFNPLTQEWENGIVDPQALPEMVGATSASAGVRGAVPQPQAGEQEYYLAGSGEWKQFPSGGAAAISADIFLARIAT